MTASRTLISIIVLMLLSSVMGGCAVAHLAGAMAQEHEYQKLIQVHAEYDGLQNKRVAVIVDADYGTLWEFPLLIEKVAGGVAMQIQKQVPGIIVIHPGQALQWQHSTPQWNAMPLGDICVELNVDRVVLIDMYEFRLNPPGNQYLWEGVAQATIGVIERDGIAMDSFVEEFNILVEYPTISGVDRNAADAETIERGLLLKFIKETAWLFYMHEEPKYPDRYRPELQAR